MAEVADNAIRATLAYRGAVEDYGNFVDTTMRQYGWTMPDASGQYSVMGAQDAFDPDRVIQYDSAGKPVFGEEDAARLASTAAMGQYGTTGLFAQTAQQSAAQEATTRAQTRARGLGAGSGLANQAEQQAESEAAQAMGGVSAGLFGDILSRYGSFGRLYGDVATGEVTDALIRASQDAANMSLTSGVEEPPAGPVESVTAGPAYTTTRGGFATSGGKVYSMGIDERKKYTTKASNAQLKAGGVPVSAGAPGQVFTGKGGTSYVRRQDGWYIIR